MGRIIFGNKLQGVPIKKQSPSKNAVF